MNSIVKSSIDITKKMVMTGKLKFKKYSPEILLGFGTVFVVGGIVLACKETLKLEDILDSGKKEKDEAETKKDEAKALVRTAGKIALNYAPAAGAVIGGFGCIYAGFGIVNGRLAKTMAAYETLNKSYEALHEKYPEGLIEKGKVKLDGEKEKKDVDILPDDPNAYSPYARFFDELSTAWRKDPEYNMVFLKAQQNYANDLLHARGHLFLNEVYDMLGIPRSKEGAVVGWIMGAGDDFVDFGLYDGDRERVRAFVNGYERSILLDFNVDGLIYDKI